MSNLQRILCSAASRVLLCAVALSGLAACGQRGPLYLPTDPAAAGRATLPQVLNPFGTSTNPTMPEPEPEPAPSSAPGTSQSTPGRTP